MSSLQAGSGIAKLPVELLKRIFELGTKEDVEERQIQLDKLRIAEAEEDTEDRDFFGILDSEDSEGSEDINYTDDGPEFEELIGHRLFFFAVAVSHVCRHWRQVALATHSLWAWISFLHMPRTIPKAFLARSGACPLDVRLGYEIPYDLMFDFSLEADIKAERVRDIEEGSMCAVYCIVPVVKRIRSLRAYLGTDIQMEQLLENLDGGLGAPLLQSLVLQNMDFTSHWHDNMYRAGSLFGGHVPKLVELRLRRVDLDLGFIIPRTTDPSIPLGSRLSNLRQMDLSTLEVEHSTFKNVLAHCPKLEELLLEDFKLLSANTASGIRPVLYDLKRLQLTGCTGHSTFAVLTSLYSPRLKELVFAPCDYGYEDNNSGVERAIVELAQPQPPGVLFSIPSDLGSNGTAAAAIDNLADPYQLLPSVEELHLDSVMCSQGTAIKLLAECQSLKVLVIMEASTSHPSLAIFQFLITATLPLVNSDGSLIQNGQTMLCPKLEHLTINASSHELGAFLRAREKLGARIKKLTITMPFKFSGKRVGDLRRYVDKLVIKRADEDEDEEWITTDEEGVAGGLEGV